MAEPYSSLERALEVPTDDLEPDRLEVEYRCSQPACEATSAWRKEFPESAFEARGSQRYV